MANISQGIRDFLNKKPYIQRALSHDIVNVRALASYVIKNGYPGASLDAVMTAIRRYEQEAKEADKSKEVIRAVLRDSRISTKSRLVLIEMKRHFVVLKEVIPKILSAVHVSKGEVLRIFEGRESIIFIVDQFKKNEVVKLIPKDELIQVMEGLGEINIHFSENYGDIPGLFAPVLNEIALVNVNLIKIVGGMPENILIIDEKQISVCHDALLRFFYGET